MFLAPELMTWHQRPQLLSTDRRPYACDETDREVIRMNHMLHRYPSLLDYQLSQYPARCIDNWIPALHPAHLRYPEP